MPKIVSHSQLIEILQGLEGKPACFCTINSQTDADARKTSRIDSRSFEEVFGCKKIFKLTKRKVLLNASYEKMVVNRRKKAEVANPEDFKAQSTYGKLLTKCLLLSSKDNTIQLRTYGVGHSNSVEWVKDTGVHLTEKEIAILVDEFLPPNKYNPKQGLRPKMQVQVNNFKLSSLRSLTFWHEDLIVASV